MSVEAFAPPRETLEPPTMIKAKSCSTAVEIGHSLRFRPAKAQEQEAPISTRFRTPAFCCWSVILGIMLDEFARRLADAPEE